MFYALFEIRSFRQLKNVSPELAEEAAGIIHTELNGIGTATDTPSSGMFLYSFPSRRTADIEKMAAGIYKAFSRLTRLESDLMGFTILLDSSPSQDSTAVFRGFRNVLLAAPQDDIFIIGQAGLHSVEHMFHVRHLPNGLSVVEDAVGTPENSFGYPEFTVDAELLSSLKVGLQEYYSARYSPRIHRIPAARAEDYLETVRRAGQEALKSAFPACFIIISLSEHPPYFQILDADPHQQSAEIPPEGIKPGILYEEYRNAVRGCIEEPKHPLWNAEYPQHTAQLRAISILETRMQAAEYHGRPLIAVLLVPAAAGGQIQEILHLLCRILLHRGSGIPVVIGGSDRLTESMNSRLPLIIHHPTSPSTRIPLYQLYWEQQGPDGISTVVGAFDTKTHIALYVIQLFNGSLPYHMMIDFLQHLEIPTILFPEICRTLAAGGLIIAETVLLPTIPDLDAVHPHPLDAHTRRWIRHQTAMYLQDEITSGHISASPRLLETVKQLAEPGLTLEWFVHLVRGLLWSRRFNTVRELLMGTNPLMDTAFTRDMSHRIRSVLWTYRVQLALLQKDMSEVKRLLDTHFDKLDTERMASIDRGRVLMERARILQHHRSWPDALKYAKGAILAFQDNNDRWGMVEANTMISTARLSQGAVPEAIDYLQIAMDLAAPLPKSLLHIHTATLLSVVQFLHGNYTRAQEIARAVLPDCEQFGWGDHALWTRFILARIDFELGDYSAAHTGFNTARSAARSLDHFQALQIFTLWSARCSTYATGASQAVQLFRQYDPSPECKLFLGEALLQCGEYHHAHTVLREAEEEWIRIEGSNWSPPQFTHGFELIENIGIGRDDTHPTSPLLLTRVLAAVAAAGSGASAEAVETLQTLVRGNSVTSFDPHTPMHYYLYARTLMSENGSLEDPNAIIGKAAKQLQERSTRMDNPRHKIAYLRHNYWSRRLLQSAQKSKMV